MNPAEALADLMEISSELEAAVVAGADGEPLAATVPDDRARALAAAALTVLGEAERAQAATSAGSLFAVRAGGVVAAATTGPSPSSLLVLHDLAACADSVDGAAA